MSEVDKSTENRLRRTAERQGYVLSKHRARAADHRHYGLYRLVGHPDFTDPDHWATVDEVTALLNTTVPFFCRDTEQVAELFNAGYQEAWKHKTGGIEHRAWLVQTAGEIIRHAFHALPPMPYDMVASQLADAILADIVLEEEESNE